jgi:hypothetical protein
MHTVVEIAWTGCKQRCKTQASKNAQVVFIADLSLHGKVIPAPPETIAY